MKFVKNEGIDMFWICLLCLMVGSCLGMVLMACLSINRNKDREALVEAVGRYFRKWYAKEDVRKVFEYMRIAWEDYMAKHG